MQVGVSGGLEAAIHTLSYFINTNDNSPDLCCLKIDMANAFNKCDRHSFLNRLQRELLNSILGFSGAITQLVSFDLETAILYPQLVFNRETLWVHCYSRLL